MKKKFLILTLSFALVICAAVGTTYAWLTHSTGKIVNTFTVGNVNIELWEMYMKKIPTGVSGQYSEILYNADTRRGDYTATDFKIIPGNSQRKQPYVKVTEDSEECYVYIAVNDGFAGYTVKDSDGSDVRAVSYIINDNTVKSDCYWVKVKDLDDSVTLYRYNITIGGTGKVEQTMSALFDNVYYSQYIDSEDILSLNGKNIEIKAFAIQANDLKDGDKQPVDIADEKAIEWLSTAFN